MCSIALLKPNNLTQLLKEPYIALQRALITLYGPHKSIPGGFRKVSREPQKTISGSKFRAFCKFRESERRDVLGRDPVASQPLGQTDSQS